MSSRHGRRATPQRFAELDAQDRRCCANNRKCAQVAIAEYDLFNVDPTTKQRKGEQVEVKACSRHRIVFEQGAQYEVIAKRDLPLTERTTATY